MIDFMIASDGEYAPMIKPLDVVHYNSAVKASVDGYVVIVDDETSLLTIRKVDAVSSEGLLLTLDNGEKVGNSDIVGTVTAITHHMNSGYDNMVAMWLDILHDKHKDLDFRGLMFELDGMVMGMLNSRKEEAE